MPMTPVHEGECLHIQADFMAQGIDLGRRRRVGIGILPAGSNRVPMGGHSQIVFDRRAEIRPYPRGMLQVQNRNC